MLDRTVTEWQDRFQDYNHGRVVESEFDFFDIRPQRRWH